MKNLGKEFAVILTAAKVRNKLIELCTELLKHIELGEQKAIYLSVRRLDYGECPS